MTCPILNYDKARDDALANRVSIRETLENQAQQAVAAEREKYAKMREAVKEWQEATALEAALWSQAKDVPIEFEVVDVWLRAYDRKDAALRALLALATTEEG